MPLADKIWYVLAIAGTLAAMLGIPLWLDREEKHAADDLRKYPAWPSYDPREKTRDGK